MLSKCLIKVKQMVYCIFAEEREERGEEREEKEERHTLPHYDCDKNRQKYNVPFA